MCTSVSAVHIWMCTKSIQMCTQMCTHRVVGPSTQLWDFNTFLKTYLISIYEPFAWFGRISQIRTAGVFGAIFLIFIEFEWRTARRRACSRFGLGSHENRSAICFLLPLFETGPWSLQKSCGPSDGETPKRGPKKHLMGSNWLKIEPILCNHTI